MGKNAGGGIGVLFAAVESEPPLVLWSRGDLRVKAKKACNSPLALRFHRRDFLHCIWSRNELHFCPGCAWDRHCGGSILWVFSTVILQNEVVDRFRGRVFAAELALVTLTMAASNYVTVNYSIASTCRRER